MGKRLNIETGDRYGKLTIIKEVNPHICLGGKSFRKFQCKCDCGTIKDIVLNELRKGLTVSCGCRRHKKGNNKKHGHWINNKPTPTYRSWRAMKYRCSNPKNEHYHQKGIRVCEKWLNSFENFLEDMGERPEGTTIDRIDNSKNYSPDNCRWSTIVEQNNNKKIAEKDPLTGKFISN